VDLDDGRGGIARARVPVRPTCPAGDENCTGDPDIGCAAR
jgi:hypothetical protein